jgi:hypothetical protein
MKDGDFDKPIIAVVNSFTQFVPGHVHLENMGLIGASDAHLPGVARLCDGMESEHWSTVAPPRTVQGAGVRTLGAARGAFVLRLIGRSLTCASLCVIAVSSLGCGSDKDGPPQGSAGAGGSTGGSPTGSAGAGAGGMLGVAGATGSPGGSGPGGGGAAASAQVQFVLKEVH